MKIGRRLIRLTLSTLLLICIVAPAAPAAWAATAKSGSNSSKTSSPSSSSQTPTGGGNVQGYAADKAIQIGTIVQLQGGNSPKVLAATNKNLNQMYGVAVDPHLLSLTLSSDALSNEAYIATSGTYSTLVSTEGGPIQTGDFVTLSAVDGVAMKADTNQPIVFGRAVSAFSGKSGIGNLTLKDVNGNTTKTVTLGLAQITINIERNPNKISTTEDLPKYLQKIGQAIAQKQVSPIRIYLSIGITGLTIIVALVMLYSGIRHALIAIGRNPLSKKSIFRGLLEVILTGFLILIIGLFAVYLLLKL